ncbi:MAG: DUF1289 domain-containing protein [Aquimonas sp.]|nr:DUF1289 domain-containing protein [Aquimonas sp.]
MPILSPCIGICELSDEGLCSGCLRTSNEITLWSTFSATQREYVMDVLLPQRERELGLGAA